MTAGLFCFLLCLIVLVGVACGSVSASTDQHEDNRVAHSDPPTLPLIDTSRLQNLDGFTQCKSTANKAPIAEILGVQVSPAVAKQGGHVTVSISFRTPQKLMGGKITTSLGLGTIELGADVADLCGMLASSTPASHCPLSAGTYTISHGFNVPAEVPSRKYTIRVSIASLTGDLLACFVTSVRIG